MGATYACALLILTIIFSYAPLAGWVMAFTDYYIGAPLFGNEWVGWDHFVRLTSYSNDLVKILRNTVIINIVSVANNLICALVLTLLLREVHWKFGAKAVQTVTFFPISCRLLLRMPLPIPCFPSIPAQSTRRLCAWGCCAGASMCWGMPAIHGF